ncbi:MAG: hypothetical protein AB7F43_00785 [Bacteriovoracia bacterium]
MFRVFILFISVCIFASCGSEEGKTVTPVQYDVPNVIVDCESAADCASNALDGKNLKIYWILGLVDCYDIGVADKLDSIVLTLSCAGGVCSATMTQWINPSTGTQVYKLDSGIYTICGFVDHDSDDDYADTGTTYGAIRGYSLDSSSEDQVTMDWWNSK